MAARGTSGHGFQGHILAGQPPASPGGCTLACTLAAQSQQSPAPACACPECRC